MICINCFKKTTNVINSRPHKNQPTVWRRRRCPDCETVFTTIEKPSLAENQKIYISDATTDVFSLGRLIISISNAFSHDQKKAAYDSMWLAQTVEQALSTGYGIITPDDIAAVTHQTLKKYDELAALQYAAKHRLIATTRRRGRPSLSPSERVPPIDVSPSQ